MKISAFRQLSRAIVGYCSGATGENSACVRYFIRPTQSWGERWRRRRDPRGRWPRVRPPRRTSSFVLVEAGEAGGEHSYAGGRIGRRLPSDAARPPFRRISTIYITNRTRERYSDRGANGTAAASSRGRNSQSAGFSCSQGVRATRLSLFNTVNMGHKKPVNSVRVASGRSAPPIHNGRLRYIWQLTVAHTCR